VPLDSIPHLLDFLWSWKRLGDEDGPKEYVERNSKTDDDFISVMRGLRGVMAASGRVFRPITPPETEPFLDREAARSRLKQMAERDGTHSADALELLGDMRIGDEHFRPRQETFFAGGAPKTTYDPS
jgi:hypothetical protein